MEIFIDDDTKLTLHGLQQYFIRLEEPEKVSFSPLVLTSQPLSFLPWLLLSRIAS
jgi:hypothetical protein